MRRRVLLRTQEISNHAQETTGLRQLMVEDLQDLYDAEKQLTRALPKVAKAASDEELVEAIREHLDLTKGHSSASSRHSNRST